MGKALFVTGTGTDIGKTYVTGLIVKRLTTAGLNASYYKAALSGAVRDAEGRLVPGDAALVAEMAGLKAAPESLVSYIYEEAVSPHLAARHEGREIDFDKVERDFLAARAATDYLTVEGSGGIICPLRWDEKEHVILDDLIVRLGLRALVVADAGLGTINATFLTIKWLEHRGIEVAGVIFNNSKGSEMEEDNALMVEELTGVKVLARVPHGAKELPMSAEALAGLYR